MSAINAPSGDQLLGDVCPPWCSQTDHWVSRGENTCDEDKGVAHGFSIASWPSTETGMPIDIDINAYRHDLPENDWPDHVLISGPGDDTHRPTMLTLTVEDAVRLGAELARVEQLMLPHLAAVPRRKLADPVRIGDAMPDVEAILLGHSSETAPDCIKKGPR